MTAAKHPSTMTDAELRAAADDLALRVARGTTTMSDVAIVNTLSARLANKAPAMHDQLRELDGVMP
ncbi:hypothetical protein [Piscinibacter gummiphilus]|uniref:Uncharacterized protein n=1 Tax=Piscinibacter gummiphilus TaxID=946333 RepID=A0ABZ0CVF5_9BURK|nr:hypothetical protein [Piscinibacter gummiphilus]WOB06494.1 hypothetical protein RXV79_16350 [Piscinibacter gummiphilus]